MITENGGMIFFEIFYKGASKVDNSVTTSRTLLWYADAMRHIWHDSKKTGTSPIQI